MNLVQSVYPIIKKFSNEKKDFFKEAIWLNSILPDLRDIDDEL